MVDHIMIHKEFAIVMIAGRCIVTVIVIGLLPHAIVVKSDKINISSNTIYYVQNKNPIIVDPTLFLLPHLPGLCKFFFSQNFGSLLFLVLHINVCTDILDWHQFSITPSFGKYPINTRITNICRDHISHLHANNWIYGAALLYDPIQWYKSNCFE